MSPQPCPADGEPQVLECPRGCGFITSAEPSLKWGPWRMQVHLLSPTCPRPIPGIPGTYARGGYRPPSAR